MVEQGRQSSGTNTESLEETSSIGSERGLNRTIAFTLGFDATSVIARLSEVSLHGDENLVFIVPRSSSARAIATQKTLESHVAALNSHGFKLNLKYVEIGEEEPSVAIAQIYDSLSESGNIIVELSGGMRYLVLVTFLACLILANKVIEVTTRLESDGRKVRLPLLNVNNLRSTDAKLLEQLSRFKDLDRKELASFLEVNVSNISRPLTKLDKEGFVVSKGSHPERLSITPLGRVLLDVYREEGKEV